MYSLERQLLFTRICGLYVLILVLVLGAHASEIDGSKVPIETPKNRSQVCPKVLPIFSEELRPKSRRSPDRIVNGDRAPHMRFYMAALVSQGRGFFCSASLLSKYWAITAAHCVIDRRWDVLRVGGTSILDGTDYEIERTISHPRYFRSGQGTEENDVQLIKLKNPVPSGSKFFYINNDATYPATTSFARTCGYGDTYGTALPSTGLLREVDVPIQDSLVCQNRYEDINVLIKETSHICAGYEKGGCDSCYGDSGGPLFTVGKELILVQIGIVSFGFECAVPLRPGVYTRLSTYIPWMSESGAVFSTTTDGVNIYGHNAQPTKRPVEKFDEDKDSTGAEPNDGQAEDNAGSSQSSSYLETHSESDLEAGSSEISLTQEPKSACFPSNALVTLENGMEKKMMDLIVGDRVRVGADDYSEVFMFTHRRRTGSFKFVRIECQTCETPLLLSLDHVISSNGLLKPACEVQVGDLIIKASGQHSEVTHISHVYERGLFNPQTLDGRIIVNDVLVTTYTTAIDKQIAHALLAPLRFYFRSFNWIMS